MSRLLSCLVLIFTTVSPAMAQTVSGGFVPPAPQPKPEPEPAQEPEEAWWKKGGTFSVLTNEPYPYDQPSKK